MINDILISFFQEKNYVIIPRKGVLIKVKDSKHDAESINFIYNPSIDYSEIITYTKSTLDVDDTAANAIIEGFCALMDSHLKNKREYEIGGIATLCTDHKWGIYMLSDKVIPCNPIATTAIMEAPVVAIVEAPVVAMTEKPAPEKRLDALVTETPHRKVEVAASVTFADKYIKQTDHAHNVDDVLDEVKEIIEDLVEANSEVTSGEIKEIECHNKLNEIFATRRVQDSSADLSGKLNELYQTKKKEEAPLISEPTTTHTQTHIEPPKKEEYVVPKKKGVDKTIVFFIISILLFFCALGYYFIIKNDVDLKLPGGKDSVKIEQVEIID